jgi:transporter family-2 protein
LFGQLLSSLIIDHFGLLGAKKAKITWVQVAGLVAMIVGIALIKLMK